MDLRGHGLTSQQQCFPAANSPRPVQEDQLTNRVAVPITVMPARRAPSNPLSVTGAVVHTTS